MIFGGGFLMSRIETFVNEEDLLKRIQELKDTDNVDRSQLTVYSNDTFESLELNEDVQSKTIDGTAGDKFVSYFSAGGPEDRRIENMNLTHEQEEAYRFALKNHQSVLFIDNPAYEGAETTELKDLDYDPGTVVIDMDKLNE